MINADLFEEKRKRIGKITPLDKCIVIRPFTDNIELDRGVTFISADPSPTWNGSQTLFWTLPHLEPGDRQKIALQVLVNESLPDGALLKNCFAISSDELERSPLFCIHTPVLNETRLEVTKKPLQKAVRRGEEVDYIITVCNRGCQPATTSP